MKPKHIYWFAYYNADEPSVRYRAIYPLKYLSAHHNFSYDLVMPGYKAADIFLFLKVYLSVLLLRRKNSVIVYQKLHTKRIYGTLLKWLVKCRPANTVYDIDDADYLKFPPENIRYFIRHSSHCIVGSRELGEYAATLNNRVSVLTSPIIEHNHIKQERNKLLTIGWVGYYNAHRASLMQLFFPALVDLGFEVKLIILGVVHPNHFVELNTYFELVKNVKLELPVNVNWQDEESVYQIISTFDIGVAPLLNTELNRAKSAFKLKQYLSCGVPVLGSDIGENSLFLKYGINGYVCNTPDDYSQYFRLIKNATDKEYTTLSVNAIDSIAGFSMANYCEKLVNLVVNLQ